MFNSLFEKLIFKKTSEKDTKASTRIFAGDMWAIFNLGSPQDRYQKFINRSRFAFKRFIDSILLHDEIIIPTQDFLSLSILIGVLGEDIIVRLLEDGVLKFCRLQGAFAYIGNGGGIQPFEILTPDNKPIACRRPIDEAIKWSVGFLTPKIKYKQWETLIAKNTSEIDANSLHEQIRHETYMDVLNSPYLRTVFALGNNRHMDKLQGIKPNAVRLYGGPDAEMKGDEIDIVMSMASANLELRLAEMQNCNDSSTASLIGHLIKAKAQRAFNTDVSQAFLTFSEIADIPDIGEGVLEKKILITRLLRLRNSKNGIQFRQWFHENCRKDSIKTGREFGLLLKKEPFMQSLPVRIIRFFATTAITSTVVAPFLGPTAPGVGVAVGVVDSFFLDRWLKGYSPKYFVDDLRQLSS